MSEDRYDDGLVHGHSWGKEPVRLRAPREAFPQADASGARIPSTVHHDDHHQVIIPV